MKILFKEARFALMFLPVIGIAAACTVADAAVTVGKGIYAAVKR